MKTVIFLFFIVTIMLVPANPTRSQSSESWNNTEFSQASLPYNDEDDSDLFDEDSLLSEQRIFSRQVYLEKLSPLEGKEKIIWAFRMAESDLFQ